MYGNPLEFYIVYYCYIAENITHEFKYMNVRSFLFLSLLYIYVNYKNIFKQSALTENTCALLPQ